MLAEAIEVMRELWSGKLTTLVGRFYSVENAQLYDLPSMPVPVLVAADGPDSVEVAAQIGDGLVTLSPDADLVAEFRSRAGSDRPVVGLTHACVAGSEEDARRLVAEKWPTAGVPHLLNAELPLPRHFEAAARASEPGVEGVALGPDGERHLEAVEAYASAGFDRLYVHQIGPDQVPFLELYADAVLPAMRQHQPAYG
jgi:G6PDH family F420-dependent oxidoreductase